jgi:alpha-L-rhamnosidase
LDWKAEWVWGDGEESPRNAWRCFRKTFSVDAGAWDDAQLAITADSRYLLWVNGELVGRGPARSWPFAQMYDTYDVGSLLVPDGPNAIAVLVQHYGVSTFSYIRGRGGLLAQLDLRSGDETVQSVVTDSTWKTTEQDAHDPRAPRLSLQMGFSERYDARVWNSDWTTAAFDDKTWCESRPIGPVSSPPWTSVVPRDIPALAEEVIRPSKVDSLHRVKPVSWTTTIDVRTQFDPTSRDHANYAVHAGYLATIVRVPQSTPVVLGLPSALASVFGPCSVNGVRYDRDQFRGTDPERYLDVELQAGDNWLVFDVTAWDHGNGFHFGIDSDIQFEMVSPLVTGPIDSAFVAIGPFVAHADGPADATWRGGSPSITIEDEELFEKAAVTTSAEDLKQLGQLVQPVPLSLVSRDDVFASCVWVRSREPILAQAILDQLATDPGTPVEIPRYEGFDTELVVDFGRILSGYFEFEVDAPEGVVLDFYGFEFIHDGERQHTFRVDNTLRYTCRQGRQRYTSTVRRGLRYLMITVRGPKGPVSISNLSFIQSNYPAPEIGSFECSDPLLDQIYEISRHTTRVCMEDTFVDCPTYEQTFWVGDSRNESLVAYTAFGAEPLIKRCLNLVPGSRSQTPFFGSQVPSGWTNVIPNWTFLWVIACQEYYERTADQDFARAIWPDVCFTLDQYLASRNSDGLLSIAAWNLLDWAPMDQPNDGVVTPQNCFFGKALRAAAEIGDLVGDARSGEFRSQAARLSDAINRHLWSDEREAYLDAIDADGRRSTIFSMPTQAVAYLCEVAQGDRAARVEELMLKPPTDFVPIGSPFMSFFHYEALAKCGRFDEMLADMRTNYGSMLEYGATTCWEMYPNYSVLRANPRFLTRSHCHAWSAGPVYFLGRYVLGVRSSAPGWTEIEVEPWVGDLTWARGSVALPGNEKIDVSWTVDDHGKMELSVQAPPHVKVNTRIPDGYDGTVSIAAG